jgi:VanZ family protein
VILVLTSFPASAIPSTGVPHIDKVMHFAMYGVLGALSVPAVLAAAGTRGRTLVRALAAIAVFAAFDEWHQHFIPGRSAEVADWAADVAGGSFALLLLAARVPRHETTT